MVKLQDLPTELLAHIVSYVAVEAIDEASLNRDQKDDWDTIGADVHAEIHDLYDLCLVSHKFRALAQPLLFQYFDEDYITGDLRSLISFTRSITLRPDLGESVQTVDTSFPGAIHRVVRDLKVGSEEQRWLKAIEARDLSVFLALLLSKTPNLTTLAVSAGEFFVKPVSHLFTQIPSFLSKLDSLILAGDHTYPGYSIATYRDFFPLPLLKHVIADYGDLVEANCPSWEPGSLSIESLFFKLCHIDSGSMKRLIRGCKKLTSFALTDFARNPRQGRFDTNGITQFSAAQLHTELLAHKDTLSKLHFEENYQESTKIGSLREFSVLDQISIQHQLLPPKPQFPASLKTLYITDCNTSIRDMTQHIADECRKGLLPALRTFKVLSLDITQPTKLPGQRIPTGQTPEQCFLSIRDKFKGTDVDFEICPYVVEEEDSEDDYYYDEFGPAYDSDYDFGPMGGSRMTSALIQALQDEAEIRHHYGLD